jgi:hypothetical protein
MVLVGMPALLDGRCLRVMALGGHVEGLKEQFAFFKFVHDGQCAKSGDFRRRLLALPFLVFLNRLLEADIALRVKDHDAFRFHEAGGRA